MSDIFKLRVCIGNANIELEGEGELVHTIFSELRENGLGNLSVSVDTHQVSQNVVDNKIYLHLPLMDYILLINI